MSKLNELLIQVINGGASDLHIAPQSPPLVRMHGILTPITQSPLSAEECRELLESALEDWQKPEFSQKKNLDFAYQLNYRDETFRFRVNLYCEMGGIAGSFRVIPSQASTLKELYLPEQLISLTYHDHGLVLLTGPASSGKTTTMASLVETVNASRACHIITIEDPIEFVYSAKMAVVHQREVGLHTAAFETALRSALREDPDVILVGELRTPETIQLAITAAETGHLVFATVHSLSAPATINRLVEAFPPAQRSQIRNMMAESLRGVITQYLVPMKDRKGRAPAIEVLIGCPPVTAIIREGRTFLLYNLMLTEKNLGMIMLEDSVQELVSRGLVAESDAQELLKEHHFIESIMEEDKKIPGK